MVSSLPPIEILPLVFVLQVVQDVSIGQPWRRYTALPDVFSYVKRLGSIALQYEQFPCVLHTVSSSGRGSAFEYIFQLVFSNGYLIAQNQTPSSIK